MMSNAAARSSPFAARDEGIVYCVVGEQQYAIRGSDVRLIARGEQMRPESGDDGRAGTIAVGGFDVPVYPLGPLLARRVPPPGARAAGRHIAITGDGGEMAGWLVDRIARTALEEETAVAPLPSLVGTPATTWFEGVLRLGGRSLLLLAPDRLDPRAQATRPEPRSAPPIARSDWSARAAAKDIAVLFSTPALPDWHAARYALSATRLVAVAQSLPVMPVPGSAPHVTGIASWRDAIVSVVDCRGSAIDPDDEQRRYLVARSGAGGGDGLLAFRIDADVALHHASSGDRRLPVNGDAPPFVVGVFTIAGVPVALVDLDRLFEG